MAAAETRWGEQVPPPTPAQRFEATDRAIANLDRLIAEAGDNLALKTRLRLDRMLALRDRIRMNEVVSEGEALRAADQDLPDFARQAMADGLLYLRRPRDGLVEYDAVIATDKTNIDAQFGRFYSLLESEDVWGAYAEADRLLATQSPWRHFEGNPTPQPRDEFLDALLLAGTARAFGDQPAEAWARLAPVLAAAPVNVEVRLAAARAEMGREWPRAAETDNRIALGQAPTLLAACIAVADSAIARDEYAEARIRVAALVAEYPENQQVQRLNDELAAKTGWLFTAEIAPANESGGGTFGNNGNELVAAARIYSPLIDDSWRMFAGYDYANAHPVEGFTDRQRATLGLQMTLPDFTASLGVHQDFGTLDRFGGFVTGDWLPDDHWRLAVAAERISIETPLRALLYGIEADSVNARVTYSWNEATSASVGTGWMPFTDGNRRCLANAHVQQVLLAIPKSRLTGMTDLYTSTNSRTNVPYYSPAADGSATLGVSAEHTVWRRYENSLTQALTLEGGVYGERNYTGGLVGSVAYEHRWRFDPRTELRYGASVSRRIYDGDPARVLGFFIGLSQHL